MTAFLFRLEYYGEEIQKQLSDLGLSVDIIFPNPDYPINKILGTLQGRGCLYGICIDLLNQERRSLTLNVK